MRIGQRWLQAKMPKCYVIFTRALGVAPRWLAPSPSVAFRLVRATVKGVETMTVIDQNDLYNYFQLYEDYQQTVDPSLKAELDKTLSEYKDRFHKHPQAVLKLLSEREKDFVKTYEVSYEDLVFDLEMHAKTMEAIKRTHIYDAERDMWVPKP